ncbi:cell division protein FtsK [Actinocatenispora sera]|uniref:S-DNA-T family DNA segregation ATPase FtsK/SpoIIIE n=1 Tax=Actinocatenispora sera TaxID=390989 RepID=A0A810KZR6_9ACTN|nr:cell division protein FtsK [Actinocatenispora sera]BCJ27498.1 hypothetical protein Asera_16060 [Actinocatenispora sera]
MATRLVMSSRRRTVEVRRSLVEALPFWVRLPVWCGVGGYRLVKAAVQHPRTTAVTATLGTAGVLGGRWALAGVVLAPVAAAVVWRIAWPASFKQRVTPRLLRWQRRWIRYGRRWNGWMMRCRLGVSDRGGDVVVIPQIRRVEVTPAADRLLIDVPAGLTVDAIRQRSAELANAARALDCRVRSTGSPGLAWVEFQRKDVLVATIPALPIPRAAEGEDLVPLDLAAVPVGTREDGTPWTLPVLGRHVLVAGRSRAGKGSVLWSVLRYLAPAIRCGLVKVSGIDPKGGMELSIGRPLFTRYEADQLDAMVALLEAEADHMDCVASELAGNVRKFTPSMEHPLHLVVVDELATLTAYAPMEIRRRAENALGRLLTKGAAVGWAVLGLVQEPSKDIIPMRGLFTYRLALCLDTPSQVDMVLGDGMRDLGALADQISLSTPGMGYALSEFEKEPFRVRAAYVADDEIRAMAGEYAPITTDSNDIEDIPAAPMAGNGDEGQADKTEPADARPVEPVEVVELEECPPADVTPVVPDSLLAKLRNLPAAGGSDGTEAA